MLMIGASGAGSFSDAIKDDIYTTLNNFNVGIGLSLSVVSSYVQTFNRTSCVTLLGFNLFRSRI